RTVPTSWWCTCAATTISFPTSSGSAIRIRSGARIWSTSSANVCAGRRPLRARPASATPPGSPDSVLLGCLARPERAQVLALARLLILLLRVQAILARLQLANHRMSPRDNSCKRHARTDARTDIVGRRSEPKVLHPWCNRYRGTLARRHGVRASGTSPLDSMLPFRFAPDRSPARACSAPRGLSQVHAVDVHALTIAGGRGSDPYPRRCRRAAARW